MRTTLTLTLRPYNNFDDRVDARFVTINPRLSFASETKLAMTEAEEAAWKERITSSLGTSSSSGERRLP